MDKVRRNFLKYAAALPFFAVSKSNLLYPPLCAVPAALSTWNILLHGLYVVQWTSPDDSKLMRLIFPAVDAAGHEHGYKIGDFDPTPSTGYRLTFNTIGGAPSPDPQKNILLPSDQLSIPKPGTGLKNVAHCWLDLPRPSNIIPLRSKSASGCGIIFCGRLGKTIQAQVVPMITLLTYTFDPTNVNLATDIPAPKPTPGHNLLLRSEPKRKPTDNGIAAYKQLLACLGIQQSDFDTSGDCCPPPPQDENTIGISRVDESSLQEIAGDQCLPPPAGEPCNNASHKAITKKPKPKGKIGKQAIQIRACMTVISAP